MPMIPAETTQLVVVQTADWSATAADLQRWVREPGGAWRADGAPTPAVVGRSGLGWGLGLHPAGLGGPVKAEGDGRAPAGLFRLGPAAGKAAAAPSGARLPYAPTGDRLCVDDPSSIHYNRIVPGTTPKDWTSAEVMSRRDWLYDWLVVADHNAERRPGAGSCIFVHVWRAPDKPTVGCTAASPTVVESLVGWLDPAAAPLLVQLPVGTYREVATDWGLP